MSNRRLAADSQRAWGRSRHRTRAAALATASAYLWSLAPHRAYAGESDVPQVAAAATEVFSRPLAAEVTERVASVDPTVHANVPGGAAGAGPADSSTVTRPSLVSESAGVQDAVRAAKELATQQPPSSSPERPLKLVTGADKTGVSSQAISVPQGAGKIQGMGESFSAQLSTGIATFSVPFALPSARGGAQPSLGLSYSSSSGHGVAGVGWDIGVPSIARQSDRGVPKYIDPPAVPNKWHAEQDRFIFNGGQELVPICTVGADCVAPKIQAGEVIPSWNGWQYFRARVEGGFQRFFWSPDHQTWRVEDKSGSTLELGVAADEPAYLGALEADPGNAAHVYRWNLIRQYDAQRTAGGASAPQPINQVRYRYSPPIDGVAYLTDIYDTSPAGTPTSIDVSTYAHHAHLRYELRLDPTFSYQRGWRAGSVQRLQGVDVTSAIFKPAGSRKLVRRYHLAYAATSHVSLLESVVMEGRCGNPGTGEENEPVQEDGSQLLGTSSCPKLPPLCANVA
jgi:hypothetical protein